MQADAAVSAGAAAVPAPRQPQELCPALGPCQQLAARVQGGLGCAGAAGGTGLLGLLVAQEQLLDGVCVRDPRGQGLLLHPERALLYEILLQGRGKRGVSLTLSPLPITAQASTLAPATTGACVPGCLTRTAGGLTDFLMYMQASTAPRKHERKRMIRMVLTMFKTSSALPAREAVPR